MTEPFDQLDTLERDLLDLSEAEGAGVFQKTRVDAVSLVRSVPPHRVPLLARHRLLLVPAAACLIMVIGVWSVLFGPATTSPNGGTPLAGNIYSGAPGAALGEFGGCFHGPNLEQNAGCATYDYDADGDVDLADFTTYQMAFAAAAPK
jgi:hypothetical protein